MKRQLTGKDSDAGNNQGQAKGVTEDEMVGWHYQLNGHEFQQIWETGKDRKAVHGVAKGQTQLSD